MAAYEKVHLTFEQQVDLLIERGLGVPDRAAAITALSAIGYYRLSAYSHQFRIPNRPSLEHHDQRHSEFLPGVKFQQVMALWEFDRNLRLLMIDGLERFEVSLRNLLAYTLGKRGAFAHLDIDVLDRNFTAQPPTTSRDRMSKHDRWLEGLYNRQEKAANEAFVAWFQHKYDSRIPIWVAIEFMEMGQLSYLFQGCPRGVRDDVAAHYGVRTSKAFTSWIASLNSVRNTSAHHSRLWNRTLVSQISRPKAGLIPALDHLQQLSGVQKKKLYPTLAVLVWILRDHVPSGDWFDRLIKLLKGFPSNPVTKLGGAGFPDDWETLPLWR